MGINKNGSFKKKKVYFSQVSNHAARDNHLSLKAKGLYLLIQSYITLENFTLYKNTLIKDCQEGEKAFNSAWKELKDKGYLIQEQHRNSDGSFYYLYDLLNYANHTPKTVGMDNHPSKKDSVDEGECGEQGIYNNTNSNNTDFNNTNSSNNTSSASKKQMLEKLENEFEKLWEKYPNRKGKKTARQKFIKLRKKYSLEELTKAVNRYAKETKNKDKQYIAHGQTFFTSLYEDYLDANYESPSSTNVPKVEEKPSILDDIDIEKLRAMN